MNNPLISVIVPVYKVEPYLPQCLDSIIGQTYKNLEIILVDDGSPDRCGEICDEYAQKDSRIKVIHQHNGGVVRARNAGIAVATGDWLSFVDSDDWLDSTMYEELLKKTLQKDVQIVCCDWYVVNETTRMKSAVSCGFEEEPVKNMQLFLEDKIKGYLWNKIIERDFYNNCRIKSDVDCTIMEDKYVLLQLLYNNPKMAYIDTPLYNYLMRDSSASNNNTICPFIQGAPNVVHMYEYLQEKGVLEKYKEYFFRFVLRIKFLMINNGDIEKAQHFIPSAHRFMEYYPMKGVIRLFYWCCLNMGKVGCWAMKLYINLK